MFVIRTAKFSSKTTFPSNWEISRIYWRLTGNVDYIQAQPTTTSSSKSRSDEFDRMYCIAEEERAKRKPRSTKPVRVRELNILNAFREPNRMVEFNRPLPLPRMIELITQVWQEAQQNSTELINSSATKVL